MKLNFTAKNLVFFLKFILLGALMKEILKLWNKNKDQDELSNYHQNYSFKQNKKYILVMEDD